MAQGASWFNQCRCLGLTENVLPGVIQKTLSNSDSNLANDLR